MTSCFFLLALLLLNQLKEFFGFLAVTETDCVLVRYLEFVSIPPSYLWQAHSLTIADGKRA